MEITTHRPPREFAVGADRSIVLKDCGKVFLEPDEQVTFVTASGAEYDVTRKSWGFYATPSLNARLPRFGLRGVLTRGPGGDRFFLQLVERGKEAEFYQYLAQTGVTVVCWLDCDEAFRNLQEKLGSPRAALEKSRKVG
jgi:hypothetical protein